MKLGNMKRMNVKPLSILLALAAVLLLTSAALAANGYELSWLTVDGGGGLRQSADGAYKVHGTIGQPDAGAPLSGGDFTLIGAPTQVDVFSFEVMATDYAADSPKQSILTYILVIGPENVGQLYLPLGTR